MMAMPMLFWQICKCFRCPEGFERFPNFPAAQRKLAAGIFQALKQDVS
jgi:hypothetical protein